MLAVAWLVTILKIRDMEETGVGVSQPSFKLGENYLFYYMYVCLVYQEWMRLDIKSEQV